MNKFDLSTMLGSLENFFQNFNSQFIDTLVERSIERCNADVYCNLNTKNPNITYEEVIKIVKVKLFIQAVAPIIIESNNAEEIYNFAKSMPVSGQVLNDLANTIVKMGDAKFIYKFAKDVKGAPIDILVDAIIRTNDAKYIKLFRDSIPGVDYKLLNDVLERIEKKNKQTFSFQHEPACPRETADKGISKKLSKSNHE